MNFISLKRVLTSFFLIGITCFSLVSAQTFDDMSDQTGFDFRGRNRGVSIADFDNDGLEDIYVSRLGSRNLLFHNKSGFEFEEIGIQAGVDSRENTMSSVWFDLENDGDLDLFLVNAFSPNQLFRNDGGAFTDISEPMGIGTTGNSKTVHAADYDNDGDVDLYVTVFSENNILWRNEAGTAFTNVIEPSGIIDTGSSLAALWVDYDLDGDQDIYQTRDGSDPNLFFRNNGDGTFDEISSELGLHYVGFGMGADVADINDDGKPDLYLTNLEENRLYLSNEEGTFDEVSGQLGIDDIGMGWSTFFFDCNNNGLQDLYVANDSYFGVNGQSLIQNRLYVNKGNLVYESNDAPGNVQNQFGTYGAAFADFDLDGKLDIVLANTGDNDGNQVFRNTTEVGNHIGIRLRGRKSNARGIGSRIEVHSNGNVMTDYINAGSGYAAQNTEISHFGLGDSETVDSMIIYWPSGQRQTVLNPEVNTISNITEPIPFVEGAVVWTDPAFPTQSDDVTVYFNAAEGNGELAGFTGDVYAHTGVVTNLSPNETSWRYVIGNWGTADSRVLMQREEPNIYSLSYNIKDFYNVPDGEAVSRLAFVFRNVNGSLVGRDSDGSDIFTPVADENDGLLIIVNSPSDDSDRIFPEGDSVLISALVNMESTLVIRDNTTIIYEGNDASVQFYHTPSEVGQHDISFTATSADDSTSVVKSIYTASEAEYLDAPEGVIDGINYTDSSYIFQLYAPEKKFAYLFTYANNWSPNEAYRMIRTTDSLRVWIELERDLFADGNTAYQYALDQALIADPYTETVLDPFDDPFVDPDIMAGLPEYPANGQRIISTFSADAPTPFDWQYDDDFEKPEKANLVIYELLVRDFLAAQRYDVLIDTLDYLERLGVNAIQLMPVSEFEGNLSWGYNVSFHHALDKYYGRPEHLKRLVDEAHRRGMAVILDMVFNHTFGEGPLARLYWNGGPRQPTANSPYCNVIPKHPFNVGYDMNHESEALKSWLKRTVEHWIRDYHVDGYRFDLSKGFTQRFSGDDIGFWGRYDAQRIATLKEYADHIWSIDPDSYVILEHFSEWDEEKELADHGMLLWAMETEQLGEAAMGYRSDLEGIDYTTRGWDEPSIISFMESHDEQRLMYKIKEFGDGNAEYNTRDQKTALERVAAVASIFYSVPGPKMLWQFGEVGYDFPINYCPNGTIDEGCRTADKPVRWDFYDDPDRNLLFRRMAAMIHLKTTYPTFSTKDFTFNDGNFFLKTVHLRHPEMDAVTLANFRIINSDINPKFPYVGTWYEYITGDSIEVTNTEEKLTFGPGEYRIYTSERIMPPGGFITSVFDRPEALPISLVPNPAHANDQIFIEWDSPTEIESVQVTSLDGRAISAYLSSIEPGLIELRIDHDLSAGIYFVHLVTENQRYSGKLVVVE